MADNVVKFKYRIVVNEDTNYPFRIERKGWFFWHIVEKCRTIEAAQEELKKAAKLEVMRPGSVILEYTEQDFLVDKLKGEDLTHDGISFSSSGVERFRF